MNFFKKIKRHSVLIVFVVGILLSILSLFVEPLVLTSIALVAILTLFLDFYLNYARLPSAFRHLTPALFSASDASEKHPLLQQHINDKITDIDESMNMLTVGKFSFPVVEVPPMSIRAMQLVDEVCILLFPVSKKSKIVIRDYSTSQKYYEETLAASKRLSENTGKPISRIFIISDNSILGKNLIDLMNENQADGLDVRVISHNNLPNKPLEVVHDDFGYYRSKDYEWLMSITGREDGLTDYDVDTDVDRIAPYANYAQAILANSGNLNEFLKGLSAPMNGTLWETYFAKNASNNFEMDPPHGLSEEDAELMTRKVQRQAKENESTHVLVMGMTPKLLSQLSKIPKVIVTSLDLNETKPKDFDDVTFLTGNWLTFEHDKKYDFLFFDESINNLNSLQLTLFLRQVRKYLKTNGLLIGRVFGRFDPEIARKYQNIDPTKAIEMLRSIEGKFHSDFASLIICLLHSTSICFDRKSDIIHTRKWNELLAKLKAENAITNKEYQSWRLNFEFSLFSPSEEMLLDEVRSAGFNIDTLENVSGTYTDRYSDVLEFYKITSFGAI